MIVKDSATGGITFPDPTHGVARITIEWQATSALTSVVVCAWALAEFPGAPEKDLIAFGTLTITPEATTQST